jgi:hypothetical protein
MHGLRHRAASKLRSRPVVLKEDKVKNKSGFRYFLELSSLIRNLYDIWSTIGTPGLTVTHPQPITRFPTHTLFIFPTMPPQGRRPLENRLQQAIELVESGQSIRKAATITRVAYSTLHGRVSVSTTRWELYLSGIGRVPFD